jgi:hypothetical protein
LDERALTMLLTNHFQSGRHEKQLKVGDFVLLGKLYATPSLSSFRLPHNDCTRDSLQMNESSQAAWLLTIKSLK